MQRVDPQIVRMSHCSWCSAFCGPLPLKSSVYRTGDEFREQWCVVGCKIRKFHHAFFLVIFCTIAVSCSFLFGWVALERRFSSRRKENCFVARYKTKQRCQDSRRKTVCSRRFGEPLRKEREKRKILGMVCKKGKIDRRYNFIVMNGLVANGKSTCDAL